MKSFSKLSCWQSITGMTGTLAKTHEQEDNLKIIILLAHHDLGSDHR
jgi:hypothetical protein